MPRALLAALAAVLVLVPASAAAARKPDLRVTRVVAASAAQPGGPLAVSVSVAAARGPRVRATTVRAYLSADRKRSKDDVLLAGKGAAPALRSGARKTAKLAATVPAAQPAAARYVVACVDDPSRVGESSEANNCAATVAPVTIAASLAAPRPMPASPVTRIADDLARGAITAQQALAYRVLALFNAPELPAQYAGDVPAMEDGGALRELANAWPSLPLELRRTLAKYLGPPVGAATPAPTAAPAKPNATAKPKKKPKAKKKKAKAKKKAHAKKRRARAAADADPAEAPETVDGYPCVTQGLHADWNSVVAAGGKVRINWQTSRPQDGNDVPALAALVTTAYARYAALMGREPLSDDGLPCYHGEDGALDIYMVRDLGRADGLTIPSMMTTFTSPDCDGMPSFIQIDEGGGHFTKAFTVAHELFHAFQNAYSYKAGCADYTWFDESAANWAANLVLPTDDSEHFFERGITAPHISLESDDYDNWVFQLWMEKAFGEASIRKTYEAFEQSKSTVGVDKGVGGLRRSFLDFARHAWNQGPQDASYNVWDRFDVLPLDHYLPIKRQPLALGGAHTASVDVPVSLDNLARAYRPFDVADPKVKEISFRNPLAGDADARMGAILVLKSGAVRFDDWSQRSSVTYCLDKPGQDVASAIVVYANSALESHQMTGTPQLRLRDTCDSLPWHYKVLSASLQTHAHGSKDEYSDHLCATLGGLPYHGETDFSAASGADPFSTTDDVAAGYGGALKGEITVDAPATFDYTLVGCQGIDTGDPIVQCSKAFGRSAQTPWSIGFSVEAASPEAETATLTWAIDNPTVGFFDADDSVCNVQEIWRGLDSAKETQQVPLSKLSGTEPVTLTFSGTDSWDADQAGHPAILTYAWDYSMTIQRVDEAGNPL